MPILIFICVLVLYSSMRNVQMLRMRTWHGETGFPKQTGFPVLPLKWRDVPLGSTAFAVVPVALGSTY